MATRPRTNFDGLSGLKLSEIKRSNIAMYHGMLRFCSELDERAFPEATFLLSGGARTAYAFAAICKKLSAKKDSGSKKRLEQAENLVMSMSSIKQGNKQPKETEGPGNKGERKPHFKREGAKEEIFKSKKTSAPKDCNGMDLEKDSKAVKVFKKPIVLGFEYAKEDTTIETKEGSVKCARGDAVLTGTQGERWPIPRQKFEQTYDVTGEGQCAKKKIEVLARQMDVPFTVKVSWSADPLVGKKGDWLVQYGKGDFGIVDSKIFSDTYAKV